MQAKTMYCDLLQRMQFASGLSCEVNCKNPSINLEINKSFNGQTQFEMSKYRPIMQHFVYSLLKGLCHGMKVKSSSALHYFRSPGVANKRSQLFILKTYAKYKIGKHPKFSNVKIPRSMQHHMKDHESTVQQLSFDNHLAQHNKQNPHYMKTSTVIMRKKDHS